MGHKLLGTTLTGVAAAMILGAPAFADQDRVSATEKGSLLIYSKIELRWSGTAPFDLIQDTFLSISNDNENAVKVQLYAVNGDRPLAADPVTGERAHPGWNRFNNTINLTANQPFCWSAADGSPNGVAPFTSLDPGDPPGRPALDGSGERVLRGFVYAWAIDNDGDEIEHDHLFGNGMLLNYANSTAWEYNTWAHQVNNGAIVQDGVLNLDGNEYSPAFNRLVFNFPAVNSDVYSGDNNQVIADIDVTLHPVSADLRQEGDGPLTTKADFFVWNENEVEFSEMHRCITCWDQTLGSLYTADLLGIPNMFLLENIGTDCAYARVDGVESQLCDVDVDPTDGPLGTNPGDVESVDAALAGVVARLLDIDGGAASAASGVNMVGTGTQAATIQWDVTGGSEELNEDNDWVAPISAKDIQDWLEGKANITTRGAKRK